MKLCKRFLEKVFPKHYEKKREKARKYRMRGKLVVGGSHRINDNTVE